DVVLFCLSLCCAIITSLHFCWPSTSPTGQGCIVCQIWKIARTQSIDAKLMNTLLAYIYGAFLVPIKQFHLSHMSVLCFTAAFPKEFCEKYGVLQHYSLVTWGFNSYLYFSCITRNNDCNYLSGKSLKFLFEEIVIVGEICKA
uniref:Secreted protein n=1 Tax=Gorilla gorilla gorilla TaxID=9595 RepID=A0A2I2Z6G6_GORGO